MGKLKILNYFLIMVFLLNLADAATIYGNIYDLSLKRLNNVIVEIDTSPKQSMVAQNGSYSLNVPPGSYTIKAQLLQKNTLIASVQENITVKQDGSYVLDLILFPDVEEGIEDINVEINGDIIESGNNNIFIIITLLLILAIASVLIYKFNKYKKQKKEQKAEKNIEEKFEDNDLEQIIKIIKQEGGRTTQKDIRKEIPLSEAKISLMLAELEHKGIIEKIKKGRGNIIILKKK